MCYNYCMTVFKIIFIVLLLIPIALLMRYFLGRLSKEAPAQTDSSVPVVKRKRTVSDDDKNSRNMKKIRSERRDRKNGDDDSMRDKVQVAEKKTRTAVQDADSSSYTPRRPEKWERSDRIPFGEAEGYRVEVPKKRRPIAENPDVKKWRRPSDAARERSEEEALKAQKRLTADGTQESIAFEKESTGKKKKNRSEKSPSKRQLRKNRERARKRDLNRRKKEREARSKDRV